MYSGGTRLPKAGAWRRAGGSISATAVTASTRAPINWASSPSCSSMMTMQVRGPSSVLPRPKRSARSMIGTTAPRKLITPRTSGGIIGTWVMAWNSRISRT